MMRKKIAFYFIILTIFSACKENISSKKQPKVINGTIDLRNWDFARDGIVNLDGEWKFFWKKLYSPEQLKDKDLQQSSEIIQVPASWNGQKIKDKVLPSYGYGTYSLKILLKDTKKNIFFKLPTAGSAFEFYINGEKLASAGKVGTSEKDMTARYSPQILDYTPKTNELDIVVHVSNFFQQYGGLWYSINTGTHKAISKLRENNVMLELFIIGIFLIMALYYLTILAMRRDDKLPLYFALFCLIFAARILFHGEFLILDFIPDISLANIKRGQYLTYFFALAFLAAFLEGSFTKDIHKVPTIIIAVVSSIFSLLVLFTDTTFFTYIIHYFQIFSLTMMLYYVYSLILVVKRKRIGGVILSIGILLFFLATINDILYNREIINTFNAYHYGLLAFIFSQSLLMSKRFSMAFTTVEKLSLDLEIKNSQLSDLNQNLEEKVEERTEELAAANQEMLVINEDLIRTRDSLWGEMQLAKKIQTVLLPELPAIEGFEIAAHMTPADDVGGDYYDVINVGGYDWVVIGDVSGHGVPAGLIMMMVQTSIHSILIKNPDLEPSELLTLVNKTIRNNIVRLGEDKYMTITVFLASKNGELNFSGLHQDIFIYRAEKDDIEIVETNGFWLGIVDEIGELLLNEKLNLKSGDIMLLYTDGITESWTKEGDEGGSEQPVEMYGEKRLAQVLKESCKKSGKGPVTEIKDSILKSLENYISEDDITFVVLKRT